MRKVKSITYEVFQSAEDRMSIETIGDITIDMEKYRELKRQIKERIDRVKFTTRKYAQQLARLKYPNRRAYYLQEIGTEYF